MRIDGYRVFKSSAESEMSRIVIRDGNRSVTFAQLLAEETAFAKKIVALTGDVRCRPIAGFFLKYVEMIIADTAIIHTGNAYMNMDVKTPPEGLANVLRTAQPLLGVKDEAHKTNIALSALRLVA